ncbi:hypothetical protein PIROE2DRAFT_63402 [Piromyces sp. E2]|nr:hypothetical protein PIROE2DRAFT_63402 [Piromyces sp. E2]|eukprot:OUM60028.1 hypothetical protein PIROE2DRAFT_63402 [Piromyces sp. E2]
MVLKNIKLENIQTEGGKGINTRDDGKISISNSTFNNCHFEDGIFEIDSKGNKGIIYNIKNSNFYNNTSINGSILNIKYYEYNLNDRISFNNSLFENNSATNFGGVVYSNSPNTNQLVFFEDCIFNNNTAGNGNISYSLSQSSEPNFSNIKHLQEMNALSTNPTKVLLDGQYNVSIFSGEKIPDNISCKLYDDYNNVIKFDSDIGNFDINNLVSFQIENVDEYNVELFGQTKSYCWEDKCPFPPIKVVGNPGIRTIRLNIKTFGKFYIFK